MYITSNILSELPQFYILSLIILITLLLEALINIKQYSWSITAIVIYATTASWYFIELIYTPEAFAQFSLPILEDGYLQVLIFLVSFRTLLPYFHKRFLRKLQIPWHPSSFNPQQVLRYVLVIWLVLLIFGISRMNGNIIDALFPLNARAGTNMWARAAGANAGPTGFIISSASYIYLLVCSFLGILLPLQKNNGAKLLNLVAFAISLPLFMLGGARNQLLALIVPGILSYAIFFKHKLWIKFLVLFAIFCIINYVMTIIITYRNIGFTVFLEKGLPNLASLEQKRHEGLNMMQELCFINTFYQQGTLKLNYGWDYITEIANIIPRAIWPAKPLIGIEYAKLRGFSSGSSDIGVFATVSTGFIGQGVINFGPYFGPVAPGLFFAMWAAFLSRLWLQRYSIIRLCLFLVCLGTTFNIGRGISLLVLWPIIFGYILVRFLENAGQKRHLALQYKNL